MDGKEVTIRSPKDSFALGIGMIHQHFKLINILTQATTPGVGDATTAGRIGVPRPNHAVRRPSVGPSDGRRSRPGSDPPTTITKYSGETRPELWLADYRLAWR